MKIVVRTFTMSNATGSIDGVEWEATRDHEGWSIRFPDPPASVNVVENFRDEVRDVLRAKYDFHKQLKKERMI